MDAAFPQRARVGGLTERFFRPGLTGIRALAAGWVMLFHLSAIYGPAWMGFGVGDLLVDVTPLVTIGWVGVNLFFVLSGFLLTTHLLEDYDPSDQAGLFRRYAKARFLRVFPAYWAQIAVLLAVSWTVHRTFPDWVRFLPLHFFMIHNGTLESNFAINAVYWTLPIEMNFYIALPFLVKILAGKGSDPGRLVRRMLVLAAVVLLASFAYRVIAFQMYQPHSVLAIVWAITQLPGSLDQFALGMLAAVLYRWTRMTEGWRERATPEQLSTLLFLVGMGGAIAMMHWVHHTLDYWSGSRLPYVWYPLTSFFLAMVVLAIALSSRITRFLFENRAMVYLGTISYSIYLWHYPVSGLVAAHIDRASAGRVGFALAAFAATVAVASVSYYLVERPFMRWGARG